MEAMMKIFLRKKGKIDNCSTEETNIVDYSQSISSTPKDHMWMKNGNINEDFDVVIKTNVKRVKRITSWQFSQNKTNARMS
ncbi:hypothetical protein ACH3XW_44750 [Acanthocheilonema viteae]